MLHRCLICGRFYKSALPDESACDDHVYDWNRLSDAERRYLVSRRIHADTLSRGTE